MRISAFGAAAITGIAALLGQNFAVYAAEVRLITLPAFKSLFEELAPNFETATGHKLVIEARLFSQLKERIDAGDFDVAVSTATMTDYLAKQNKTVVGTRVEFSRVGIGAAVAAGSPKPDISSVDAFKRALLNAKSISIPTKESTAGAYLSSLVVRLGLLNDIKSKLKESTGGGQTPRAIATGEADLGLSLLTEFVHVKGVEIVGPIPSELQRYVIETAAVGIAAKEPNAADTLVEYLMRPVAVAVIKAEGMEPIPPQ
jgi:molybdate transport system substrate-binding protein